MKTPVGEAFTVPGVFGDVTYYTYPCKFEDECGRYNPERTVTVAVKGICTDANPTGKKTVVKPNVCVCGGGCVCSRWRRFTSADIGWYEPLANRSFSPKGYSRNHPVDHRADPMLKVQVYESPNIECAALDAQAEKIKRLKGLEMQSLC